MLIYFVLVLLSLKLNVLDLWRLLLVCALVSLTIFLVTL